jgi:hypothetical protein
MIIGKKIPVEKLDEFSNAIREIPQTQPDRQRKTRYEVIAP